MLVVIPADHFLQHVASDERNIRRTLGEPAHEIRIPLRSEWNVDTHPVSVAHELFLEVAPHSVQHLKLESVRSDVVLACEAPGFPHHSLVVSCDSGVVTVEHQLPHAAEIRIVDLLLLRNKAYRVQFS